MAPPGPSRLCLRGPRDAPLPWRCPGNTTVTMATAVLPPHWPCAGIGQGVVRVTGRALSDWTVGMVQNAMGGGCWGAVTGPECLGPLGMVGSRGTHQALEQSGRAGDDDEEFLHQLGDEGHLLRLRALVGLGGGNGKGSGHPMGPGGQGMLGSHIGSWGVLGGPMGPGASSWVSLGPAGSHQVLGESCWVPLGALGC